MLAEAPPEAVYGGYIDNEPKDRTNPSLNVKIGNMLSTVSVYLRWWWVVGETDASEISDSIFSGLRELGVEGFLAAIVIMFGMTCVSYAFHCWIGLKMAQIKDRKG